MAKKKKPAANPARGFATTSIASKSRTTPTAVDSSSLLDSDAAKSEPLADGNQPTKQLTAKSEENDTAKPTYASQDLSNLTPEEIESKLENDELQLYVDRYAEKSFREAHRHIQRLLAERRLLRSHDHTHRLYLPAIFGHELIDRIIELERHESARFQLEPPLQHKLSTWNSPHVNDGEAIQRLWILKTALESLGFDETARNQALNYAAKNLNLWDNGANSIWGLEECLHWLVLSIDEASLPDMNATYSKNEDVPESGRDEAVATETEDKDRRDTTEFSSEKLALSDGPYDQGASSSNITEDETIDDDIESDVEPEQLPEVYLELKSRLYQLAPDVVDGSTGRKKSKTTPSAKTIGSEPMRAKKLSTRMNKIESDPLFDKASADEQWTLRRNEMAQKLAQKKKLGINDGDITDGTATRRNQRMSEQQMRHGEIDLQAQDTDHASDIEGDVFAALFQSTSVNDSQAETGSESIAIRDFGRSSGLSPRRVLEEAVRSRDSKSQLHYKNISEVAFSSRHSLKVVWSKGTNHPSTSPSITDIPGVTSQVTFQWHTFAMKTVGTPDARQSEAFISVVALFQIFPASTKVHLRLPTTWRELWHEFAAQVKKETDKLHRETVRKLKQQLDHALDAQSESTSPTTGTATAPARTNSPSRNGQTVEAAQREVKSDETLKALWEARAERSSFKHFLEFRQNLPIFQFREIAINTVEQNQVTIICGETGCGKSTQMPSFILENEIINSRACKIYCTEPRRISAITLAQRVSQELGEAKHELGTSKSLIGYAIRLESKVSPSSRLIYATTGIVLRMLESLNGLNDVTHIVIDEVHERSIETDFLLIILRKLMKKRPDLKLILMSATVNAEKFANYFGGAPVLNVPGRTFPVETSFLEDALELTKYVPEHISATEEESDGVHEENFSDPTSSSSKQLVSYSETTRRTLASFDEYKIDFSLIISLLEKIASDKRFEAFAGAVLVFLPGIGEIRRLSAMLQGTNISRKCVIHALHSAIASEDQQQAFQSPPRGFRKIVLSTNIAETGVTIPDVTCVIDTGKHREMRFDERRQVSRLTESFISRANAKQRRGRAGRVQAGICYHLFTRARHDSSMLEQQTPEMLRLSLQDLVMRVKSCKLGDIQATLTSALDPPSEKNVRRAIETLKDVGALTADEDLTQLGIHLSKLPLDPYLGKLVVNGAIFKCLDVSLTMAATLTSKSPFLATVESRNQTTAARAFFAKGESDLITDFNAYASWKRTCIRNEQSELSFCRKNMLNAHTLATIEDLKAQLMLSLAETGLVNLEASSRSEISRINNNGSGKRRFLLIPESYNTNSENYDLANGLFAMSFYPKIITRDGNGWRNIGTNQQISLHPSSILRTSQDAMSTKTRLLSYYSVLQTSAGMRYYNATGLNAVPAVFLALLAGEASFLPVAQGISLDSGRVRFSIEAQTAPATWRAYIAIRALRNYLQNLQKSKLQNPQPSTANEKEWNEVWDQFLTRCSSHTRMAQS